MLKLLDKGMSKIYYDYRRYSAEHQRKQIDITQYDHYKIHKSYNNRYNEKTKTSLDYDKNHTYVSNSL